MKCPGCGMNVKHPTVAGAFVACVDCPYFKSWEQLMAEQAARDPLLEERQKTHGSFETNAIVWKKLCEDFNLYVNQRDMNEAKYLAVYMILLKLARASQNPNVKKNFENFEGIANL